LAKSQTLKKRQTKKPRGRPKTIKDELRRVTLWLPVTDIDKIDSLVRREAAVYKDRSEFIRDVLARALSQNLAGLLRDKVQAKIVNLQHALKHAETDESGSYLEEDSKISGGWDVFKVITPEYLAACSSIHKSLAEAWSKYRSEAVGLLQTPELTELVYFPEEIGSYSLGQLEEYFESHPTSAFRLILGWSQSSVETLQPIGSALLSQFTEAMKLNKDELVFEGPIRKVGEFLAKPDVPSRRAASDK